MSDRGSVDAGGGSVILRLICVYMENQLSYFVSSYPLGWMMGLMAGLTVICFGSVAVFVNNKNES